MTESSSPADLFRTTPRGDPALPRRVRCLNPFRWLEVNDGGEVTPCCSPWFKGSLGSIPKQSLEEIWNGERFQQLREAMYPGGKWERFCNAATCPHIKNDTWIPVDFITPETPDSLPIPAPVLEAVREGVTRLPFGPAQVGLSCDPRCNLRCIMCSTVTNPARDGSVLRAALEGVRAVLPTLSRLKLTGDGEVFAIPEARDFLFTFDAQKYPQVQFLLHTNGVLLTSEVWKRIGHLSIDWLVVSIDAATRTTYEKIRVGGNWRTLQRNLEFLADQHRAGRIREFHLCMCVMKSNHREVVAFAEMGRRLGATSVFYIPILGDYGEEQIFDRCDVPSLLRLRRQLRHPLMNRPGVDFNAIQEWRNWTPTRRDWKRFAGRSLRGLLARVGFRRGTASRSG